ncbi:MAG: EAL domain-containing protein [Nitrospirae bacterium]|nr:EAL domain-containing protein [Nitrospirota bacterium]MCL5286080.1 EAL domain-containing protein [Nitrospirota bacterium]
MESTGTLLNVLVIEDSEDDCRLLLRELERGGFPSSYLRVDSPESLREALRTRHWDIVFSDYSMPEFTGTQALAIIRDHDPVLPFIFVSGTIGEEVAVNAMRQGAQDYVMKDNIKRLIPAVARELREASAERGRRRAEEERRKFEVRFQNILTMAADAIISVDEEQRIVIFNRGAETIFGYTQEEAIGLSLDNLIPEKDRTRHRAHVASLGDSRDFSRTMTERRDIFARRKDGSLFPAEASISKLTEEGRVTYTVILRDISERKRSEERLHFLAHHHPLTHLPNRLLFHERLEEAMRDARTKGRRVGVAFLDLDRFKTVNDSLGHSVGDDLLKRVAERLREVSRGGDTVAHLSGDEFALILANMGRAEDAHLVVAKIQRCFSRPFKLGVHELFTSISLGVTLFPDDEDTAEGLLRNADIAMYRAKGAGGDTFRFYSAEMTEESRKLLTLGTELRRGLERKEFLLHYQPFVSLSDGRISGMEALVRWQHPERGIIYPNDFIPYSEETGLIVPLGKTIIRRALGEWRRLSPPFRLAVNVSPRQFHQNLFETFSAILDETGFDPACLEIEITESTLMENIDHSLHTMKKFHEKGVQFSVDDFGTGYSNLSYLKRYPISRLKIDRSFIVGLPDSEDDAVLARAIIAMARSLGLEIIAEGIETPEQKRFLGDAGCQFGQGYLFSRPKPPSEMDALLRGDQTEKGVPSPGHLLSS